MRRETVTLRVLAEVWRPYRLISIPVHYPSAPRTQTRFLQHNLQTRLSRDFWAKTCGVESTREQGNRMARDGRVTIWEPIQGLSPGE